MMSVCFPFVIKQGCVACRVVVSAFNLAMSHMLICFYPWNIVVYCWMKRGWWPRLSVIDNCGSKLYMLQYC